MTLPQTFLARLRQPELDTLARLWTVRSYRHNEAIIAHRDSGRDVFFLLEGRARVTLYSENGREIAYRDVGPGEIFGELAGIDGKPRSASVVAIDDLTAVEVTRESLEEELALDSWMGAFTRALAVRFRDLDSRLSAMRAAEERQRVLTWLRDWTLALGTVAKDGVHLETPWAAAAAALQRANGTPADVALLAVDRSDDMGVDQTRDVLSLESPAAAAARAASSPPRPEST